jgi:hypothetical protein
MRRHKPYFGDVGNYDDVEFVTKGLERFLKVRNLRLRADGAAHTVPRLHQGKPEVLINKYIPLNLL